MGEDVKLPEGWKKVKLGEVIEKLRNGYVYSFSEIRKEGLPITRIETISEGKIDKSKLGYITEELRYKVNKYQMQRGDILFSHINSIEHIGKCAIYDGSIPTLIHGMNLLLLRTKKHILDPFFLINFLKKEDIRSRLRNLSGQAVNQVSIKPSELAKFAIPLPPLPEQQKIAEILETVDRAIEKTDKIIEKYKRIKQGLMQDLLTKGIDENGKIRSEKTHKFKDSPIGRIPEEWEVVRLGEVCFIIMGQSPSSVLINKKEKGIPFLQGNAEFTSKYPNPINWIEKPLKIAKKESILLSVRAPVGALNIANREYCIGRGLCSIVTNKSITHNLFIWYYLQFSINNLINLSQGSTFEAISSRELKNYSIPLPPLTEQQRIAEILSQIDNVIEKEQAYRQKLERIKKGLMEDLLTGKVRVNKLIKEEDKK